MSDERQPDRDFWRERNIFVTGHTGFVGGWLLFWLARMGAHVTGYSLDPPTKPSFHDCMRLAHMARGIQGDVRDRARLTESIAAARPQIVLHLAAQPLVSVAFYEPYETFTTNVLGTLNVLEAALAVNTIDAVVVFTTDKVYAEAGTGHRFREADPLGGAEPYALSKASAEFAVMAYRHSQIMRHRSNGALVTVRAGNIVGGGDWAADRLVPDAVRAFQSGLPLTLRRPDAVRPWQFVLDAAGGLLVLAEAACSDPRKFSGAWNFGPPEQATATVAHVADTIVHHWGPPARWQAAAAASFPETPQLEIDSSKAILQLGWKPRLNLDMALRQSIAWYRSFYAGKDMLEITGQLIDDYCSIRAQS
jgi:CDP-glucose 4,6-dehydratase